MPRPLTTFEVNVQGKHDGTAFLVFPKRASVHSDTPLVFRIVMRSEDSLSYVIQEVSLCGFVMRF